MTYENIKTLELDDDQTGLQLQISHQLNFLTVIHNITDIKFHYVR